MLKYGFDDAARSWNAPAPGDGGRVAAGTVARAFLRQALGVEVVSHVISIGASEPYAGPLPNAAICPVSTTARCGPSTPRAEAGDDRRDRGRQEGR